MQLCLPMAPEEEPGERTQGKLRAAAGAAPR